MRVPILNLDDKRKEKILRNRLAAHKTHERKKEHIDFLEKQNSFLLKQNQFLLERLLSLENTLQTYEKSQYSSACENVVHENPFMVIQKDTDKDCDKTRYKKIVIRQNETNNNFDENSSDDSKK
ncbi:hypothetical protein COBT_001536, partial [Conglomerata obtusa]